MVLLGFPWFFLWFCLVFLGFPLVLLGFPWFSPAAPLWSVTPGGPARRPPCGTSCPGGWPAAPLWNVRRRPARRRKTKENQRKTKQNQRKTKQNQGKPRKTKKIRGIPLGGGTCSLRTYGDPSHWEGGGTCNPQPHIIYLKGFAPHAAGCYLEEWWLRGEVVT